MKSKHFLAPLPHKKKKLKKKDLKKFLQEKQAAQEPKKEEQHELPEKSLQKKKQGEGYMKLARLGAWLHENNAWIANKLIAMRSGIRGSGHGFGVIARKRLREGQSLCIIPKDLVISVKTCGVRKELEDAMIIGEVATALALLYEKSRGEESRWFAYLDMLPEYEPLPFFWDEEDKKYLQGTDVEKIVSKYRGLLKEDYKNLVKPLIEAHPEKFPADIFTFENFFKASSLVSSRAFMVDSYHNDSMVPLADLFNHKTAAESAHFESVDGCAVCGKGEGCEHEDEEMEEEEWEGESEGESGSEEEGEGEDAGENGNGNEVESNEEKSKEENETEEESESEEEEREEEEEEKENNRTKQNGSNERKATDDEIEMVVVRQVLPNTEIYNTFGELSNSCLLTKYGFTEPENPFDTVDLKVKMIVSMLSSETLRTRFSKIAEFMQQKVFEVGFSGEVEPNLIKAFYICVSEANYNSWEKDDKKTKKRKLAVMRVDAILDGAEKSKIAKLLVTVLEERDKRYSTTLKKDLKDLKASPAGSYARYALILRVAERQILQRAMARYSQNKKEEKGGKEEKKVMKSKKKVEEKVEKEAKKGIAAPIVIGKMEEKGEKKKAGPIVSAPRLLVPKTLKQPRGSKIKRKKLRLRIKRSARTNTATQRAKKAMEYYTEEHKKLVAERGGKFVPFPKLFPLDLRKNATKRPLQIRWSKHRTPSKKQKLEEGNKKR